MTRAEDRARGQVERTLADTQRDLDDALRALVRVDSALSPNKGENIVDAAKRVARDRDEARTALATAERERDEAQNEAYEARSDHGAARDHVGRLEAHLRSIGERINGEPARVAAAVADAEMARNVTWVRSVRDIGLPAARCVSLYRLAFDAEEADAIRIYHATIDTADMARNVDADITAAIAAAREGRSC